MRGTVKLGDFGISKIMSTNVHAQTVLGTPYYFSPEMVYTHKLTNTHKTKNLSNLDFFFFFENIYHNLYSAKEKIMILKVTYGHWVAF